MINNRLDGINYPKRLDYKDSDLEKSIPEQKQLSIRGVTFLAKTKIFYFL